jgi:hypothetical protein
MTEAKAKRAGSTRKRYECCREWDLFEPKDRAKWDWQVIHQFAHSRTTFTLATLQDRAHCDERRAADLIHLAQELKWIWTPAEGIWVGQLSGRS